MMYSDSQFHLGTTIEILVVSTEEKTPERIQHVFDYFASIEQEFSRFRPTSSLSMVNTQKTAQVSSRFVELIKLSKEQYQKTNGYFNPLVQVGKLGYTNSFELEQTGVNTNTIDTNAADTDFSKITIEGNTLTLGENQLLDFGGIGKGYAVDRAARMLLDFGYENFLVNAGGDISMHGTNDTGKSWRVGIENPFTGEVKGSIAVSNGAVATSGRYKRKWNLDGTEHHHLVNPFTGENENAIMSVTLVGSTCIDCDTFTKIIFHLPVLEGLKKIQDNGMEGLVYTAKGDIHFTPGLEEKYDFNS